MVDADLYRYMYDQLELFPTGYDSLMLEFTCHLEAGTDIVQIGTKLTHCPSMEQVSLEVNHIRADLRKIVELADDIIHVLLWTHHRLSPF